MSLLDTTTAPREHDDHARHPRTSAAGASTTALSLDPYERSELRRRGTPFLLAIILAIVLLPVQDLPIDGFGVAMAITGIALVVVGAIAVSRDERLGPLGLLLPFAYLAAVELLRESTGGPLSGYAALMYIAPFWVALYDTRRQLLLVLVAMFLVQSGILLGGAIDVTGIRRALLSALVLGIMSLAVHRKVTALRDAHRRLAEGTEALERSNRELEQFAYVSSHDIQEPLRMIRSFSQLFVQRHGHALDDDAHELLAYVVDGAERAQLLVNDLLQYSLVGRSEEELVPVDLDSSLDRALATLAPNIEETGATIERSGPLPTVLADATQLDSLFVNLVGNAIKYRHADRTPLVVVSGERSDGHVRVRVRDNGIGFAPEHAERIFRMFQRLHGRTSYEGTGIGLALCARIIERHGGTIRADGVPGEGATFEFSIPVVEANGAP